MANLQRTLHATVYCGVEPLDMRTDTADPDAVQSLSSTNQHGTGWMELSVQHWNVATCGESVHCVDGIEPSGRAGRTNPTVN